jgi:hypothetical protein
MFRIGLEIALRGSRSEPTRRSSRQRSATFRPSARYGEWGRGRHLAGAGIGFWCRPKMFHPAQLNAVRSTGDWHRSSRGYRAPTTEGPDNVRGHSASMPAADYIDPNSIGTGEAGRKELPAPPIADLSTLCVGRFGARCDASGASSVPDQGRREALSRHSPCEMRRRKCCYSIEARLPARKSLLARTTSIGLRRPRKTAASPCGC